MTSFRSLRSTARPGMTRRVKLAAALATTTLTAGALLATGDLAVGGASASATRPACTRHALWQGLSRGDAQVRRLPVMNRDKRLVGIIALGDLALAADSGVVDAAITGISENEAEHAEDAAG